jgi:hypothetical protein
MTGLLGCTDPVPEELPTGETGAANLSQDAPPTAATSGSPRPGSTRTTP